MRISSPAKIRPWQDLTVTLEKSMNDLLARTGKIRDAASKLAKPYNLNPDPLHERPDMGIVRTPQLHMYREPAGKVSEAPEPRCREIGSRL